MTRTGGKEYCYCFPDPAYRGTKVAKLYEGYNNRHEKKHGRHDDCHVVIIITRHQPVCGGTQRKAHAEPEDAETDTPIYRKDKISGLKENKKETGAL